MYNCNKHYKPCDLNLSFINDGSMSMYEKMCYIIELLKDGLIKVDEVITQLDKKEDIDFLTNNRKLSLDGNFTGMLCNLKSACEVVNEINMNYDSIKYLQEQFETGATGQVIECGIFEDENITREFDGGVW